MQFACRLLALVLQTKNFTFLFLIRLFLFAIFITERFSNRIFLSSFSYPSYDINIRKPQVSGPRFTDTPTMFTYSRANTPLGHSECASYLFRYFSKNMFFCWFLLQETYWYNPNDGIERSIKFNYRALGVVSLGGLKVHDLPAIKRTS